MAKKGALEISFGWLFAIIAGAVILFFAIYFSAKLINTQQGTISAQTGKEIGILLDPLETSFESAQTTSITIPAETRIHNSCDASLSDFGKQLIQLDQKNFGKWVVTNVNVSFENKYIFSNSEIQGNQFYIFSKPFNFPFKVADLFYMTSSNDVYCFVDAPNDISTEITDLNQSNLLIENCSGDEIQVCFGNSNCDIYVNYNAGYVEKNGYDMYFAGTGTDTGNALMYAAIFSNSNVYECQLKRLMAREAKIALLYEDKESRELQECEKNLGGSLTELSYSAQHLKNSAELTGIKNQVDLLDYQNTGRRCPLW